MISLRRHVLTIVAIFLALAIGLVLGVTTSGSTGAAGSGTERTDSHADEVAGALAPAVLDGILDDRPVLLVQTPGASADDVDALAETIGAAGGLAAGRIRLTEKSFAADSADELSSLVDDLPLGDATPPDSAEPGTRLGVALGRAALLDPSTSETYLDDDEREEVMTTLADAGFVDYEEGTLRAGELVVLATGADSGVHGNAGDHEAWLARQLDSDSGGAVVAAQSGEGATGDSISALRGLGDTGVSTVDNVSGATGRLAVVLGLAEQLDGSTGAYGLRPDAGALVPTAR